MLCFSANYDLMLFTNPIHLLQSDLLTAGHPLCPPAHPNSNLIFSFSYGLGGPFVILWAATLLLFSNSLLVLPLLRKAHSSLQSGRFYYDLQKGFQSRYFFLAVFPCLFYSVEVAAVVILAIFRYFFSIFLHGL